MAGHTSGGWLRRSVWIVGGILAVVSLFIFFRAPLGSPWNIVFLRAAQRMRAGENIYVVSDHTYAYPPAMAMFAMPLAGLPLPASTLAWYLVNMAAAAIAFVAAWRLAGGPSPSSLPRPWQAVFWIAMFLGLRFFISPLESQQFDMVIAALLFAGCRRVQQGHDLSGAVLLGASAAMKCTPLLFAPYLIWRCRFRAAAVLVAVAVGLNLLPDLFWAQPSGRLYLSEWAGSFLSVAARGSPGSWYADLLQNQSLSALVTRLAQFGWPLSAPDLTAPPLSPETASWLRAIVYGLDLLLLAVTAWQFGKPARLTRAEDGEGLAPGACPRIAIEAAAVVCLMLLLSPMSSKTHYVVTILPLLWIARAVVEQRGRWIRWLLVPLAICGPLSTKGLLGKGWGDLTLAWGMPTWFALFCLLGMWLILARPAASAVRVAGQSRSQTGRDTRE